MSEETIQQYNDFIKNNTKTKTVNVIQKDEKTSKKKK